MIISSGELDQRITIERLTVARGVLGGHEEAWSDLATVWAKSRDLSGRELYNAQAVGSAVTQCIAIRTRADVKAEMRIRFADGTRARIEWIRRVTRREYMELYCLDING